MEHAKRTALWEAFFDAQWRYRYFVLAADKLKVQIRSASVAIALLSCGPLVSLIGTVDPWVGAVLGASAAGIGVWLSSAGLIDQLATAKRAAAAWNRAAIRLRALWSRSEAGEDVWAEHLLIDQDLAAIDDAVIETLVTNDEDVRRAIREAETSLATVA